MAIRISSQKAVSFVTIISLLALLAPAAAEDATEPFTTTSCDPQSPDGACEPSCDPSAEYCHTTTCDPSRYDCPEHAEGVLTGNVTGPDGPLANAIVIAFGSSEYQTMTDEFGAYNLTVQAGTYGFLVQAPEAADPSAPILGSYFLGCNDVVPSPCLTIEDGATLYHDVALAPGAILAGSIVNHAGDAMYGATVFAFTEDFAQGDMRTSGYDGTFRLTVPPGSYSLDIEPLAWGFASEYSPWFQQCDPAVATSCFTVTAGQAIYDIEVILDYAPVVRGIVIDHLGEPVAYERVELVDPTADPRESPDFFGLSGYTNETGHYEIYATPGQYGLAVGGFYSRAEALFEIPCSDAAPDQCLVLENNVVTWQNVTLPQPPVLRGFVNASDGTPVVNASVNVYGNGYFDTRTDATGYYEIVLRKGNFSASVHPHEDEPRNLVGWSSRCSSGGPSAPPTGEDSSGTSDDGSSECLSFTGSEVQWLNVTLLTAVIFEGHVYDPDGVPMVNMSVSLSPADTNGSTHSWGDFGITNETGYFRLKAAPGLYSLSLWSYTGNESHHMSYRCKPGEPTSRCIELVEGVDTWMDITLPKKVTLTGRILNPDGAPMAGAEIVFFAWDESGFGNATANATGHYATNLYPGNYSVLIEPGENNPEYAGFLQFCGSPAKRATLPCLELTSGASQSRDFTLQRGVPLEGYLRDPSGAPIVGVSVSAWGDSSGGESETNETGYYRLLVTPGQYSFMADADQAHDGTTYESVFFRCGNALDEMMDEMGDDRPAHVDRCVTVTETGAWLDLTLAPGQEAGGPGSMPPSRPAATATPGDGTATVTWPHDSRATRYLVESSTDGATWTLVANTTNLSHAFTGLANGVSLQVRVTALGTGGATSDPKVITVTPVALPGPVTGLTVQRTAEGVRLTWEAVPGTSTAPVTGYAVLLVGANGHITRFTVDAANTTYLHTVPEGTPLTYRVVAVNDAGHGGNATATATRGVVPATPAVQAVPAEGEVALTWAAVPGAQSYLVERFSDGQWTLLQNVTGTSHAIQALAHGTTHSIRVVAQNAFGEKSTAASLVVAPAGQAPVITAKGPTGTVTHGRPTLTATYTDNVGVVADQVQLFVDGTLVSANANATAMNYTPATDLSDGLHRAKLVVRDAAGVNATVEWEFTVSLPRATFTVLNPALKDSAGQVIATLGVNGNVTVTATVKNAGTLAGTHTVVFKVNGVAMGNKTVTLAPDASETVSFTFSPATSGTYAFAFNDESVGSLTVAGVTGGAGTPGFELVTALAALGAALGVLRMRRRA